MTALAGLLIALFCWLGVMQVITWSIRRQAVVVAGAGHSVDDAHLHISVGDVIRYHTWGWTLALFGFFVVLVLIEFPLWQLLGFACLLALVYGNTAISRGQGEWIGKKDPAAFAVFGPRRDVVWYRLLMTMEWATYLASIIFLAYLLVS